MKANFIAANSKKKKMKDLKIVSEDIKNWLNFSIEILGVKPEDVEILGTEDFFNQVVKHIALYDEKKLHF